MHTLLYTRITDDWFHARDIILLLLLLYYYIYFLYGDNVINVYDVVYD